MIHKILSYEQNNHVLYTLIKCDILHNNSLSFGAKGIFCYLVSKFSGWTTRITDLTNQDTNGAFSTRKMLAELKQSNIYPLINTYRSERKEQYNGAPYVKIDNDLLNNPHLSWQAKGLLIYLLSKPKDWKVCLSHLVSVSTNGRDSIKRTLKELRTQGYTTITRLIDTTGRVIEWIYDIYATALVKPIIDPITRSITHIIYKKKINQKRRMINAPLINADLLQKQKNSTWIRYCLKTIKNILNTAHNSLVICGQKLSINTIKDKLSQLTIQHLEAIQLKMNSLKSGIKNKKMYLFSCL